MLKTTEHITIPDTPEALHAPPRGKSDLGNRTDQQWVDRSYLDILSVLRRELPDSNVYHLRLQLIQLREMNSADEIADFLRKHKAQGDRNLMSSCPIASFAKLACLNADVDEEGIKYQLGDTVIRHAHSAATKDFIDRFDKGDFPDLVR